MAFVESGNLLPNRIKALTKRIQSDLTAIRKFDPKMESITFRPKWSLGVLISTCPSLHNLTKLNESRYGPYQLERLSTVNICFLTFSKPYNPTILAERIKRKFGMKMEPDGRIGDGNEVTKVPGSSIYTFKKGWGDCPSGCIHNSFWDYEVYKVNGTQFVKLIRGKEDGRRRFSSRVDTVG